MDYDVQLQDLMLSTPQARGLILDLEKEDLSFYTTLRLLEPYRAPRYNATDAGNGYLFADLFGSHARYVADKGVWYVYESGVWKRDHASVRVMELCRRLTRLMHLLSFTLESASDVANAQKRVMRMYSLTGRERILRDAASVYPLMMADMDADPWLFNCQNGVLNLRDGTFREHRSSDLMTRISGAVYDPDAACERWEQFIRQIMETPEKPEKPAEGAERAAYLQRALGYALCGDTREECLFLLYGASTRNGKGTLMETIMRMLGDYARAAQPETIGLKHYAASGSNASEDIARLQGARLVSIAEPDKKLTLSAALIKQLTGGDTITARFLHENSFEFRPQFKLFINTNHLPGVNDLTLFSSNRLRLIRFERHFEPHEQDKTLKAVFAQPQNLSAVLNWCLAGLRDYLSIGLAEPESVRKATETYRRESDIFGQFAAECLHPEPGARTKTSSAYACYQQWCAMNGHSAESGRGFRKSAISHGLTISQMRPPGGNPTSMIRDYVLRPV